MGTQYEKLPGTNDEHLVTKFILLMFLTFANANHIWFMKGVNFILATSLLPKNLLKYGYLFLVFVLDW